MADMDDLLGGLGDLFGGDGNDDTGGDFSLPAGGGIGGGLAGDDSESSGSGGFNLIQTAERAVTNTLAQIIRQNARGVTSHGRRGYSRGANYGLLLTRLQSSANLARMLQRAQRNL